MITDDRIMSQVFRFCKKKKAIRISHTKILRNLLLVKWLLRTKPSISVINQRKCKNGRYMFCDQNKDYQKSGIVCCDWRPNKHFEHISVFIDLYILIWKKLIIPTFFLQIKGRVIQTSGDPGHGIVTAAAECGADFIVVGSRGMGTIRRTLLGSVSDYLVHHSKIPVFICRH